MKIKQRPEDFRVTELDRFELSRTGPFSLYRLVKWNIGTIEAVRALSKKWNLAKALLSFGGLKDRHARTEQIISVRGGPERSFEGSTFHVEFLGRSGDPITRASFSGNRFEITVRDLQELPDTAAVTRFGFPNYFDSQRFGSLRGTDGEFIGRALVRGENEKALRLALASPSGEDRRKVRELKTILRDRWGDWTGLASSLPPSPQRSVAAYLASHPGAFGYAFELLDANLRILYISAYQSWIWNRTVAAIVQALPDTFRVDYIAGHHVFYRTLDPVQHDRLAELSVPLLTPSQQFEGEVAAITSRILEEEVVEQRQFRLKKLSKSFFGKGLRDVLVAPSRFTCSAGEDDLQKGRRKMMLGFELPKGSYATILLKRLFHEPIPEGAEEEPD